MKKTYLLLFAFISVQLFAQELPYTFSTFNETYEHLTEAQSANGTEVWDDPEYFVPIGFTMDLMGELTDNLLVIAPGAQVLPTGVETEISVILPYMEDIMDIGNDKIGSQSPILYKTEGAVGSRIFKIEWQNVGFYDEFVNVGTFNNTISFQVWFYETTNDIEYRFGDNTVKDFSSIHPLGGSLVGLAQNVNLETGMWQGLWLLGGDPANPTVSTYNDPENAPDASILLNAEPPTGTVYHFDTGIVGVNEGAELTSLSLYPTRSNQFVTIESPSIINYEVYDLVGKMVDAGKFVKGINQMNISQYNNGMYILRTMINDHQISKKFVKG